MVAVAVKDSNQHDSENQNHSTKKPWWKPSFLFKQTTKTSKNNLLEPTLYKKRWLILFLFSMSNFLCSLYQTTFSPISTIALKYWEMPDQTWKVNMMTLVYLVVYVPMSSVSTLVMKKRGLRTSILIASILNFIGGWVRCLGYKKGEELYFWIAFLGQSLCAVAQPLVSNAPTLLSNNWFGEKERTLATTIGTLCGILGSGVAFGIGPALLGINEGSTAEDDWSGSEYGMLLLLMGQALLATLLLTGSVAFFQDKPPTPPVFKAPKEALTQSTSINETNPNDGAEHIIDDDHNRHSFWHDLKAVMLNCNFVTLVCAYSVGYSVLQSFVALIDQIIVPKGYTPYDGSVFGLTVIVFGIVGALFIGVIVDRTKRYKLICACCGLLATIGFAGFAVVMLWRRTTLLFYMACLSLAALGMFSVPTVPICLEMSCEVTYPVPSSTSTSIIYGAGTMTAGAILVILDIIQQYQLHSNNSKVSNNTSMQLILWIDLGLLGLSFIFTCLFRGKYKRMMNEKLHKERSQAYLAGLSQENEVGETSALIH
ncbi:hypothetical protein C9374_013428 [Naegleria lovaniensis]|uniref:Major facilitator superfamily (MFS) profile domain-containing protein n=1 Tax=Naegleria lovaniensis TaxID=51637 RepID=A0AA88KNC3_NAELO|nr:uncharacterized protein C9374_013428 [Naegleria lovaniensis]KAG2391943.1 hypothetical protein C9374_013428 [Naegleria lovaniensis]